MVSVVRLPDLKWGAHIELSVEAGIVLPPDVFEGRELDLRDGPPRAALERPSLYISGLSADEVTSIDARLSAFHDGTDDGIHIACTLGSIGADGATYTLGEDA